MGQDLRFGLGSGFWTRMDSYGLGLVLDYPSGLIESDYVVPAGSLVCVSPAAYPRLPQPISMES